MTAKEHTIKSVARRTIEEMQAYALQKGGKCLSTVYINSKEKLLWECEHGHRWETRPYNVFYSGHWCPYCAKNHPKTLEDMQRLAEERGGKCLSDAFIKTARKLTWQCSLGHIWDMTGNDVQQGAWCPECKSGMGERICRAFFEQLLGEPFPKMRPVWLKTPEGRSLELDGYCEKLSLAFEHQGVQHYVYTKHFHGREGEHRGFEVRAKKDEIKRALCKKHSVSLIEVPSILDMTGIRNMKSLIKAELEKRSINIPKDFDEKVIDLSKISSEDKIEKLREVAISRGGLLISENYLGATTHLKWQCKDGHVFNATPNNVKFSTWCPYCKGYYRTIEDMREIATRKEGICLSPQYINSKAKLEWQCKEGHIFLSTPEKVFSGCWCPKCRWKRMAATKKANRLKKNV